MEKCGKSQRGQYFPNAMYLLILRCVWHKLYEMWPLLLLQVLIRSETASNKAHSNLKHHAEDRTAHNNVGNGVNEMVSTTWKPCVWCVWFHSIDSIPAIIMSRPPHSSLRCTMHYIRLVMFSSQQISTCGLDDQWVKYVLCGVRVRGQPLSLLIW